MKYLLAYLGIGVLIVLIDLAAPPLKRRGYVNKGFSAWIPVAVFWPIFIISRTVMLIGRIFGA